MKSKIHQIREIRANPWLKNGKNYEKYEMLCLRLKIPVFARLCHFTIVFDDLHAKTYHPEGCFMQNKANLSEDKFVARHFCTRIYERFNPLPKRKNKPNQTQYKPNSNPIAERVKMNVNQYNTKDYEENADKGYEKTNPIQTQFKPNHLRTLEFSPNSEYYLCDNENY